MNPFSVDSRTTEMVERNIGFLLGSYIETGFSYVLLSWVLHSDKIVRALLTELDEGTYSLRHFTLLCDEDSLKARIAGDPDRSTSVELAFRRLEQAHRVTSRKIDTSGKTPDLVADEIIAALGVGTT